MYIFQSEQVIKLRFWHKNNLRCLTTDQTKRIFFTDEKNFYINPPVNSQNDRVWAKGRKKNVC